MLSRILVLTSVGIGLMVSSASAGYTVTVAPSKSTIHVGDCLYFSGSVSQNGKAVANVQIGVADPMKQQSLQNVATTDSNGRFTYYPENMCPAVHNVRSGLFKFTFYAGTASAVGQVTVAPTNALAQDDFTVSNHGNATYKIKLTVNNSDKGTTSISPGHTATLLNNCQVTNSTIVATVMDNSGKILWKATVNNSHSASQPSQTGFVNPTFYNYWFDSSFTNDGKTQSHQPVSGLKTFSDTVNQHVTVGGVGFDKSVTVARGVGGDADLGLTGPGVETYVGLRAGCSLSCGASAGLQICYAFGLKEPIELFHDVGCGFSCCVDVATVSAQLASVSLTGSMQVK